MTDYRYLLKFLYAATLNAHILVVVDNLLNAMEVYVQLQNLDQNHSQILMSCNKLINLSKI